MWLPKSIYERIPQFYVLAGMLLITDGLYVGSEFSYTFWYANLYFGLGFAMLAYGVGLFIFRVNYRKAKRASETGSGDDDSAAVVEELATPPEASGGETTTDQSQQLRKIKDEGNEKGFTLIELMVVVTIIGTLAALAIPAYQNYTIRAQIAEGLTLAAGPQTAVEEYYSEYGVWPANNADAGLSDQEGIKGKYTSEIFVQGNVVEITYDNDAHHFIRARKVLLTATDNEGSISWSCLGDGIIKNKHLPPTCRGDEEVAEEVVEEEEKDGKKKKDKKDKK
jgi:type IV pilus assembly protein PilA